MKKNREGDAETLDELINEIYEEIVDDESKFDKVAESEFPNITDLPNMGSRPCSGCGNMLIITKEQLRSADEPMTKVYTCPVSCGAQNFDDGDDE
jgi:DNA-directed RNA polymerase subunit M/transcription elongation factor TFIIS